MKAYPVRSGNQCQLLVSGDIFLQAVSRAIEDARISVLVEMYLVERGRSFNLVWSRLLLAAQRGVSVYVIFDDFGSRQVVEQCSQDARTTPHLHFSVYNPIALHKYTANFMRDHRKLVVVDGKTAWVGGFGVCDEFYDRIIQRTDYREPVWLDVAVEVSGSCVADWILLFFDVWCERRCLMVYEGSTEPGGRNGSLKPLMHFTRGLVQGVNGPENLRKPASEGRSGFCKCPGRVAYGAQWVQQDIVRQLTIQVRSAKHRIWLTSPYFVTTWGLRRLLMWASRRGVDVRIFVPGPYMDHPAIRYAGRRHYRKLLAAGVEIFEYQKSFLHAKVFLCDNWTSVGSFNLDRWTYQWNLEANQECYCESFADKIQVFFLDLSDKSVPMNQAQLARLSIKERLLISVVGMVEELMLRFFR